MADMKYTIRFSHEYEAGPSGPARSYWEICYGDESVSWPAEGHITLHHNDDLPGVGRYAEQIATYLNRAVERGKLLKAEEIRKVLGVRP